MSILLAADQSDSSSYAFMIALAGIAVTIAWAGGVFQRDSVVGPRRTAPGESVSTLALFLIAGIILWMIVPMFYAAVKQAARDRPVAAPATEPLLSPTEQVVISTGAGATLFIGLLIATAVFRPDGLKMLGITRQRLLPGALIGCGAIFVVFPLIFCVSAGSEALWEKLHKPHEKEHELLTYLGGSTDPKMRLLAIVSATIVAPMSEELLFRGYLQTVLVAALAQLTARRAGRPEESSAPGDSPLSLMGLRLSAESPQRDRDAAASLSPYQAPVVPTEDRAVASLNGAYESQWNNSAIRWLAIFLTAALFALVHPWWMRPSIFFLAVCLGYVYERTGNLWASIVIHALFNASSVLLFLNMPH